MPDEQNTPPTVKRTGKASFFFFLLLIIFSLGGLGYGYYELARINISLARMLTVVKAETTHQQEEINTLQQSMKEVSEGLKKSQTLSAQQEQIIADWQNAQKGDLNRWYVAEAKYLVSLANDYVQYAHNNALALILMQRSLQILQRLPNTLDIQKSLDADINKLQALGVIDTNQLYLRLNTLQSQLDQLPLPIQPLSADQKSEAAKNNAQLPWWQAGFYYSLQQLQKMVIVRYNDKPTLPLVLPEEKTYFYHNMHSVLSEAIWGVLHHDATIYQASLQRAQQWIKQYAEQASPLTQNILKELTALAAVTIPTITMDFSPTLSLMDRYLAETTPAANHT